MNATIYETKVRSSSPQDEYLDFLEKERQGGRLTEKQYQARLQEAYTSNLEMRKPLQKHLPQTADITPVLDA